MAKTEISDLHLTTIMLYNKRWAGNAPYKFGQKTLVLGHAPSTLTRKVPPLVIFDGDAWLTSTLAFGMDLLGCEAPQGNALHWLCSCSVGPELPATLLATMDCYNVLHSPLGSDGLNDIQGHGAAIGNRTIQHTGIPTNIQEDIYRILHGEIVTDPTPPDKNPDEVQHEDEGEEEEEEDQGAQGQQEGEKEQFIPQTQSTSSSQLLNPAASQKAADDDDVTIVAPKPSKPKPKPRVKNAPPSTAALAMMKERSRKSLKK